MRSMLSAIGLFALLMLTTVSVGKAQSGPTYIGQVAAIVNGRQVPLEKQQGRIGGNFGLNPFGSALLTKFDGAHSPVRLTSKSVNFVARVGSNDVDPSTLFSLCKMTVKSDHRELRGKKDECRVPVEMQPMGSSFVRIQANNLAPGEYGVQSLPTFQNPSGGAVYLFGAD